MLLIGPFRPRREARTSAPRRSPAPQGRLGPAAFRVARLLSMGVLLALVTILGIIPGVFYVGPMPADADAVTLCVPGLGPLQRVRDGLSHEQAELALVHEDVHASQCRAHGALWFARQTSSTQGRLAMEVQALCAEASLLSRRGDDGERLVSRTVEALVSDYFPDGSVDRGEIAVAVAAACGPLLGD